MSAEPRDDSATSSTSLIAPRQREVGVARFRLAVTAGPDRGKSAGASDASEFSVGTATSNQLVLTDRTVSRHHCVIAPLQRYLVRDLGSTNGTWLGDYRVDAAYLKHGATLRMGVTSLRFEVCSDLIVEPLSEEDGFGAIIGRSTSMRRVFAALPKISASDVTVLLLGETGTGKGLLAEAIHRASPRASAPFVVVDCSSIPPTLIESELLGHERGAFTGAHAARAGAFEVARGGTVFLDEIGELPLDMQPKLLRILEERVIKRVGGAEPIKLDVRIIAATNRDLRRAVNKGTFRSDVFYRLNSVVLTVPPLRSRREDIEFLANHFYRQFSADDSAELPAPLLESLMLQEWPGNVRELRGAIERAVLLGGPDGADRAGASLLPSMSPPPPSSRSMAPESELDLSTSFRAAKDLAVARWEREYIRKLMRKFGGNLSRAARAARMDRNHLREVIRRHDLGPCND